MLCQKLSSCWIHDCEKAKNSVLTGNWLVDSSVMACWIEKKEEKNPVPKGEQLLDPGS